MGASLNSTEKGSVNVELNIVPFIDLMSCLTAFLLVTAVWVNTAALDNETVGRGKEGVDTNQPERVAVLIEADRIRVSQLPGGDSVIVQGHDWLRLESALREFKTAGDLPIVEVAADSTDSHPISYQDLMYAMDTARKVGYPRVGVTEPASLSISTR